jgi:NAD(P)-dependent dehydrogenase (short-subunit alcohol dehydrogenase family)
VTHRLHETRAQTVGYPGIKAPPPAANIRVNVVAPGARRTPIWKRRPGTKKRLAEGPPDDSKDDAYSAPNDESKNDRKPWSKVVETHRCSERRTQTDSDGESAYDRKAHSIGQARQRRTELCLVKTHWNSGLDTPPCAS